MQLKEYLFYNKITNKEFAQKIGVNRQTIEKITAGTSKMIRLETIEKIIQSTNGKVTFEDLSAEIRGIAPVYPLDKDINP